MELTMAQIFFLKTYAATIQNTFWRIIKANFEHAVLIQKYNKIIQCLKQKNNIFDKILQKYSVKPVTLDLYNPMSTDLQETPTVSLYM